MPESNQPASQKTPGSFAPLPASLTGPARQKADQWDAGALANDLATTSEQALCKYRRVQAPGYATEQLHGDSAAPVSIASASNLAAVAEKSRKTAIITLRLTASEHIQLQERAVAAQLSVSNYLRSRIFEAESLGSQIRTKN